MIISGFVLNSLVDYKGNIASVIFLGGCNFSCDYCHNKPYLNVAESLSLPEILAKIEKRKAILDGVVISGGEPTLSSISELLSLIKSIKDMGLKVKLDTNGTNYEKLKTLLPHIDYVAMDIKAPLEKYNLVTFFTKNDMLNIEKSIELLKFENAEFRTTVIPELTLDDIEEIAKMLTGGKAEYFLQGVKYTADYKDKPLHPEKFFNDALTVANKYVTCSLRI